MNYCENQKTPGSLMLLNRACVEAWEIPILIRYMMALLKGK